MIHKDCFPGADLTSDNDKTSSMTKPIRQVRHRLSVNTTFEKELGIRDQLKGEPR